MEKPNALRRREFLAASAGVAIAGYASAQESASSEAGKLALHGGAKTVTETRASLPRFGDPERVQLESMVDQNALFYWKGPQTATAIERFQKIWPAKYVMTCSSGTAALHIAVAAAGIGPGDEVITAPITDIGTVIGVLYQQGVPVFADLGAVTRTLVIR